MRTATVLIVALALVAPAASVAKPETPTRFLGRDPHGPLALALGGKLDSPPESACRTWGKKGGTWQALDAFGRVVGKARVDALDRYDVTNCDELGMKKISGARGVGLYVSGDYTPLAIERWKVGGEARRELEGLIDERDRALPKSSLKEKDPPLGKRLIAWKTPSGQAFAVVGGRGLTVLRRAQSSWIVVYRITPSKLEVAHAEMYTPVGVLDMNGDGQVEIVVHERWVDAYGDVTLTPDGKSYRSVAAGIHGAFA